MFRVHESVRAPNAFWGGDASHQARFSPFTPSADAGTTEGNRAMVGEYRDGEVTLPVLYVGTDVDGALSESVFHDVTSSARDRRIQFGQLPMRTITEVVPTRELHLADLTTDGLHRLQVDRTDLIETGPSYYPQTALWAAALHARAEGFDGMTWVARLRDTSMAAVLFGDRVTSADVLPVPGGLHLPLGFGQGLQLVAACAEHLDIVISLP